MENFKLLKIEDSLKNSLEKMKGHDGISWRAERARRNRECRHQSTEVDDLLLLDNKLVPAL